VSTNERWRDMNSILSETAPRPGDGASEHDTRPAPQAEMRKA
jgi:hypothetical protein